MAIAGSNAGEIPVTALVGSCVAGSLGRSTTESTRAASAPVQLRSMSSRAAGDARHSTAATPASTA
jgi:hypothetical protein